MAAKIDRIEKIVLFGKCITVIFHYYQTETMKNLICRYVIPKNILIYYMTFVDLFSQVKVNKGQILNI